MSEIDPTAISDEQARTLIALFRRYYLTESKRVGGAHPLRRTMNIERHAILLWLTGTSHAGELTAGWYLALFKWLVIGTATEELRAMLAAAQAEESTDG